MENTSTVGSYVSSYRMTSGRAILLISCSVDPEAGELASKYILFLSVFCEVNPLVVPNFLRSLEEPVGLHSERG